MSTDSEHARNTSHGVPGPCVSRPGSPLLQWLGDWYFAWRWRREMRRLVALDQQGQIRLGSVRQRVREGADLPLRVVAERQAVWRSGRE